MNLRKKFKENDIAIQKAIKKRDLHSNIKSQAKAFLKQRFQNQKQS